jgi:hypothetical protein
MVKMGRKNEDDDIGWALAILTWVVGFLIYPIILKGIVATTHTIWTFNYGPKIFGVVLFCLLLAVTEIVYLTKKIGNKKDGSTKRKFYACLVSIGVVYPIYTLSVFLYEKIILNLEATLQYWKDAISNTKHFFVHTWIFWVAVVVITLFFAVNAHMEARNKKPKTKKSKKNKGEKSNE